MSEHTSGPWHRNIKPARRYGTIFSGRNRHVAYLATQGLTDEEIEANCDLIAAAPDLLEALRTVRDADEDCRRDGLPTMPPMPRAKIDRAIAKAEGGQ